MGHRGTRNMRQWICTLSLSSIVGGRRMVSGACATYFINSCSEELSANGRVPVSSGFRVMSFRASTVRETRSADASRSSVAHLSRAVMLIRFAFGVIVRFFFSTSTASSLEVSFKPLPGTSPSARSALRSSRQIFATCWWWWNQFSQSA